MPDPTTIPRARFRVSAARPRVIEIAFWLAVAEPVILLLIPPLPTNVIVYVVVNLIFIAVAWRARQGFGWARILWTAGLAFRVVSVGLSAVGAVDVSATSEDWIATALGILMHSAAVVLLWLPASRGYYRAVAAEHRTFVDNSMR